MIERTETITEREYDAEGHLLKETVTTIVEKDNNGCNDLNYSFITPYLTTHTNGPADTTQSVAITG